MTNPNTAMVFAAGFGTRMRPITDTIPKALVKVHGKPLLDYALDKLEENKVTNAVINTHYLAEQIESHIVGRQKPHIFISHEAPTILETGGGIVQALPLLGNEPFFIINTDTVWIDKGTTCLSRLSQNWNPDEMDALFLLANKEGAIGYDGKGDFDLMPDGMLKRNKNGGGGEFVYSGYMIIKPEVFAGCKAEPFSFTGGLLFKNPKYNREDGAMPRLHGIVHDGLWLHIGTPEAIKLSENAIDSFMK